MKKALVSVANKQNLDVILKKLAKLEYHFISTGSTASEIQRLGYDVQRVSDVIKFEEILGGRVKTLHPNIHGAILSRRTKEDYEELQRYGIEEIDVVICNLYPFEEVINDDSNDFSKAIENIDIGGVSLLRAAAKNHRYVTVICDPKDYDTFSEEERLKYAVKAFEHTAYYDIIISQYLQKDIEFNSDKLLIGAMKNKDLRYGENAHQKASLYMMSEKSDYSMQSSEVLHGKDLSYNNIKDIDVALNLISEFSKPVVAAFKHNIPCGVGFGKDVNVAFANCLKMDDVSIFGGIVATNQTVDLTLANELNNIFLEIIIAPDFESSALEKLKEKKNLRIIKSKMDNRGIIREISSINGGFLEQQKDQNDICKEPLELVTKRKVDDDKLAMMINAQTVCKYVKSNAIVVANKEIIIAQGGGQTSRVAAAKIALEKAKEKGYHESLILASDAFFPFDDNIILAKEYGVDTIIQPGGSIKDQSVIDRADELDMAMVFTKVRHFKH